MRTNVCKHLNGMAANGGLVYPSQVLGELERYADPPEVVKSNESVPCKASQRSR